MIERSVLDDILDELDRVLPGIPNDIITDHRYHNKEVVICRGLWHIRCRVKFHNGDQVIEDYTVRFDHEVKGPPATRFAVNYVYGRNLTDCVAQIRATIQAEVEFLKGV